jgi:predicted ATPase
MKKPPFLRSIRPANLLSFGWQTPDIQLRPLNILIGSNGSGKSNFIEILGLLRELPSEDPWSVITNSGGIDEWIWKGGGAKPLHPVSASISATLSSQFGDSTLDYKLVLRKSGTSLSVAEEYLGNTAPFSGHIKPYIYFHNRLGKARINAKALEDDENDLPPDRLRELKKDELDDHLSVFSQRKDPFQYPELTNIGKQFARISLYRDWTFGIASDPREPEPVGQRSDYLEEDASNLGHVLNALRAHPDFSVVERMKEQLKRFYAAANDIETLLVGNYIQLRIRESNGISTPASRLSDGTLRWLALVTVLLNPDPPPLICIEEPELGLHPDIIPTLAELLRDASTRTQLIVTTHSHSLVDAFTDEPESICVCQKPQGSTEIERLDQKQLAEWLESYSLGTLWAKGEIGGNRW